MQCPYCKEEVQDGAIKCKHCNSTIGKAILPSVAAGQGDFAEQFSSALNLWKSNIGGLAVLTLVFLLVVWIPIANIGFIAGYTRSLLKVTRGEGKAEVGDIFNAWDCFGNLLVYLILLFIAAAVLGVIPILGALASMALGFVAMPGMYAIIDKNQGAVDAFKWGMVSIQTNLVNWLLAYIVGSVISALGIFLLFIGAILSMPLGMLIIVQQYERVKPA